MTTNLHPQTEALVKGYAMKRNYCIPEHLFEVDFADHFFCTHPLPQEYIVINGFAFESMFQCNCICPELQINKAFKVLIKGREFIAFAAVDAFRHRCNIPQPVMQHKALGDKVVKAQVG